MNYDANHDKEIDELLDSVYGKPAPARKQASLAEVDKELDALLDWRPPAKPAPVAKQEVEAVAPAPVKPETPSHGSDKNFMVQKNKYKSRAEKFLIAGAFGVVATVGLIAAAPAMATVPVLAAALTFKGASLAGFAANKIAENTTDSFEPQSKREKVMGAISSLREKAFGGKKNTNRFEI